MSAGSYTINIEAGAGWSRTFYFQNNDRSPQVLADGTTARMQLREFPGGPVVLNLTSDPGGGLVVTLSPASVTATITGPEGDALPFLRGIHDLYTYPPAAAPKRRIEGPVIVSPSVTRASS